MILLILSGTVVLVFLNLAVSITRRIFNPLRSLPSPDEHFITAHSTLFGNGVDHIETLLNLGNSFRKEGLYTLDLIQIPRCVVLLAPEFIKQIFADSKTYEKPTVFSKILPLVGNSLIVSNYEEHHWQRKLFNAAFTQHQLKNYLPSFSSHTDELIKKWSGLCDDPSSSKSGINLPVLDDLSNLTFDIIGDVGFGYQFNSLTAYSVNSFTSSVRYLIEMQFENGPFLKLLFTFFPKLDKLSGLFKQKKVAEQIVSNTMDQLIKRRKEELLAGTGSSTQEKDIVTIMLKAQQHEDSKMTDSLIKSNIFLFLLAGHETTATALSWCLYQLGTNIDVQEKLREELRSQIPFVDNLTYDDISKCKYLDAVIKETLRIHSPVPLTNRQNNKSVVIGKYNIPAGTLIRASNVSAHMNENTYPEPYAFKPERFLSGEASQGLFLTFGHGVYNCIGKNFALLELKIVLTKTILAFEFSVDEENLAYKKKINVTIKTQKPLMVRIKPLFR